jgi:hypothetical protein
VSITGTDLIAALPIREQPTVPPQSGLEPVEVAFFAALLLGGVVIATALIVSRRRRGGTRLEVDEHRVRAEMERLCRQGWTAQLTLYGSQAPLPRDAPDLDGVRVDQQLEEIERAHAPRGPSGGRG